MSNFYKSTFTKMKRTLDGNVYSECVFNQCELVFSAQGSTSLDRCVFNGSVFVFEGAARDTIEFMRAMYHGIGDGPKIIEMIFKEIQGGSPVAAAAGEGKPASAP